MQPASTPAYTLTPSRKQRLQRQYAAYPLRGRATVSLAPTPAHANQSIWGRRLRAAWAWMADAITARRDTERLQNWPDYLLRDIGLSRGEIDYAVRYGKSRWQGDLTDVV